MIVYFIKCNFYVEFLSEISTASLESSQKDKKCDEAGR